MGTGFASPAFVEGDSPGTGVAVCGGLMDTGGLSVAFILCAGLSLVAALTATVIAER